MPRRSTETDVTAYPVSYIPAYTCSVSCENTASSSYTMDYALRVYTRARSCRSRVTYVRLTRVQNATRGGAYPGANRWTAPCFPASNLLYHRRSSLHLRPGIPESQSSSKMRAFKINTRLENCTRFSKLQKRWKETSFWLQNGITSRIELVKNVPTSFENCPVKSANLISMCIPFQYFYNKTRMYGH